MMVIGNSPWARIEIEATFEFDFLSKSAKFCVSIAPPKRPVSPAGTISELKNLNLVPNFAKFERRHEPSQPSTQNEHRCSLWVAFQLDRTFVMRLLSEAETDHCLVHYSASRRRPNQRQKVTPAYR